jgi:hypothetical protein
VVCPSTNPIKCFNPYRVFGISTVYKKFCLRPICQHAVHLQEPLPSCSIVRGWTSFSIRLIFRALRGQSDVELNSNFIFSSDTCLSGRVDPEIGLLHDGLASVPAVL